MVRNKVRNRTRTSTSTGKYLTYLPTYLTVDRLDLGFRSGKSSNGSNSYVYKVHIYITYSLVHIPRMHAASQPASQV